jgi:hypothetical protein
LVEDPAPVEQPARCRLGLGTGDATRAHRREHAILQHGQMRKQAELLEHHALAADGVNHAGILDQTSAVDDDLSAPC